MNLFTPSSSSFPCLTYFGVKRLQPLAAVAAVVAGGVGVESGVDKAGKSGREDGTVQVAFPAF